MITFGYGRDDCTLTNMITKLSEALLPKFSFGMRISADVIGSGADPVVCFCFLSRKSVY